MADHRNDKILLVSATVSFLSNHGYDDSSILQKLIQNNLDDILNPSPFQKLAKSPTERLVPHYIDFLNI
jgi:hypothetical protein